MDPIVPQIICHGLATVAVFLVMNLFTCIWNPVTGALIPNEGICNIVSVICFTDKLHYWSCLGQAMTKKNKNHVKMRKTAKIAVFLWVIA